MEGLGWRTGEAHARAHKKNHKMAQRRLIENPGHCASFGLARRPKFSPVIRKSMRLQGVSGRFAAIRVPNGVLVYLFACYALHPKGLAVWLVWLLCRRSRLSGLFFALRSPGAPSSPPRTPLALSRIATARPWPGGLPFGTIGTGIEVIHGEFHVKEPSVQVAIGSGIMRRVRRM